MPEEATMSSENSTNVRSNNKAPTLWLRTAVLVGRVLGAVSPALAGRWAA